MNPTRRTTFLPRVFLLAVLSAPGLLACTPGEGSSTPRVPSRAPSTSAVTTSSAGDPLGPAFAERRATLDETAMTLEIFPIHRSGRVATLTARLTIEKASPDLHGFLSPLSRTRAITDPAPAGFTLVARGEGKAYLPAEDADRHPMCSPTIDLASRAVPLVPVTKDLGDAAEERPSGTAYDVRLNANVLFAKDSAVIRPQVSARLAQIVAELKRRGPGTVTITGYTDDLGPEEHGLVLSRQRAAAVRAVMEPDLPGYRITSIGKGEADPLVPNKDEASRAKNRRVEIHYQKS